MYRRRTDDEQKKKLKMDASKETFESLRQWPMSKQRQDPIMNKFYRGKLLISVLRRARNLHLSYVFETGFVVLIILV